MVLGIDADVHRVAYALVDDGTVKCFGTVERADSRGRVRDGYDSRLTALTPAAAANAPSRSLLSIKTAFSSGS